MKCFRPLALFFSFCFLSLGAEEIRDSSTGVTFPSTVSFTHSGKEYQLECTGVATRRKFFVKVYSVAHYLQKGAANEGDKFAAILQDNVAKQLTLKWVHEASPSQVMEGYRESFKNVLSEAEYNSLSPQIDQYLQFNNQEAHKGDEHILRWLPGGYVEVLINGKKTGSLSNTQFAKGLWSIWLGPKSVVNRDNLVSLMK
jgi:hypothetical protein